MGNRIMGNRHELERFSNDNRAISHRINNGSIPDYKNLKPGMDPKTLMLAISLIGVPSSVLAIWLNIATWKADVIWALAALFWLFKLFRACMRWRQEYIEKQIEIKEKRDRYNKDIFT